MDELFELPPSESKIRVSPAECPSPHGIANKLLRLLWGLVWVTLFRSSPPFLEGWRRFLLRLFGADLGRGVRVMASARIWAPWNLTMGEYASLSYGVDCYCVAPISIGRHATVSQYAHLCAASHDVENPHMDLIAEPIVIGEGVWVCAGAFIGMGVRLGEGSVAAARSVVRVDVPAWSIVAGNPAKYVKPRVLRTDEPELV